MFAEIIKKKQKCFGRFMRDDLGMISFACGIGNG